MKSQLNPTITSHRDTAHTTQSKDPETHKELINITIIVIIILIALGFQLRVTSHSARYVFLITMKVKQTYGYR